MAAQILEAVRRFKPGPRSEHAEEIPLLHLKQRTLPAAIDEADDDRLADRALARVPGAALERVAKGTGGGACECP